MQVGYGGILFSSGNSFALAATAAVDSAGTTLSLTFPVIVTGGVGGLTFHDGSSTYTLTYLSGSGTATLKFTIGTTVNIGDVCTLSYVAASGNIVSGSYTLGSFTALSVTNNSTHGGSTPALNFSVPANSFYLNMGF